jgi:hypothetical protein
MRTEESQMEIMTGRGNGPLAGTGADRP